MHQQHRGATRYNRRTARDARTMPADKPHIDLRQSLQLRVPLLAQMHQRL